MAERARAALMQSAPWRRGVPWWLVAIQGIILTGIGISILARPDEARDNLRQLIGVVLLITSVVEAYTGFRVGTHPTTPYRLFRSGIGVAVGLIVAFEPVSDYIEPEASRTILGLGLIAFGLIGLIATVLARDEVGLRIGALITGTVPVVLGIVFLTGAETGTARMNFIAILLIVFGLLLLAYAFYLNRNANRAETSEPIPA